MVRTNNTPRAFIKGTGSATPEMVLSNSDLERIVDTSDEWISRRTGIKERRISLSGNGESTTGLATKAAFRALEMAGLGPSDLDLIVVGTVTSDRQFPSAACMVQERLGASKAAAFDLSAGCSGFLYALSVADNAIKTRTAKTALVIGVERLSSIINWKDRGTCVLLGDGAGAVVLSSSSNGEGILSTRIRSDGSYGDLLYSAEGRAFVPTILKGIARKHFFLKMEGNRLFKKAVECLAGIAEEVMEETSVSSHEIHTVIPHQANIRIIKAFAKKLGIPMKKVYTNLHKYGNTSSASIPIALDEVNRSGRLKKDTHLLMVSFGAGLTWGASLLKWTI